MSISSAQAEQDSMNEPQMTQQQLNSGLTSASKNA